MLPKLLFELAGATCLGSVVGRTNSIFASGAFGAHLWHINKLPFRKKRIPNQVRGRAYSMDRRPTEKRERFPLPQLGKQSALYWEVRSTHSSRPTSIRNTPYVRAHVKARSYSSIAFTIPTPAREPLVFPRSNNAPAP
jgi:hypothetical protein